MTDDTRRGYSHDARRLDLDALNYRIASERLRRYNRLLRTVRGRPLWMQVLRFAGSFIKQLLARPFRRAPSAPDGDILFVHATLNQRRALEPVLSNVTGTAVIDLFSAQVPVLDVYLASLPFLGRTLAERAASSGQRREIYTAFFDTFLFIHGYYIVFRRLLDTVSPRLAVVANDHANPATTFTQAARDAGIPVAYIQHASVTENFPPLDMEYALLEGIDTLEKYHRCGPSRTTVFLVGMPRYDRYHRHLNTAARMRSVAISTNALDPPAVVDALAGAVRTAFPDLAVTLRPHPTDTGPVWQDISRRHSIGYSDPHGESSFEYLSRHDVLVSGNSNILLEAALMNVVPELYDFSGEGIDYYGFAVNGLVDGIVAEPEELVERLAAYRIRRPVVRPRTRRYNAVVDTIWDGRSSQLAASVIGGIAGNGPDMSLWEQVDGYGGMTVFRPVAQGSTGNSSST